MDNSGQCKEKLFPLCLLIFTTKYSSEKIYEYEATARTVKKNRKGERNKKNPQDVVQEIARAEVDVRNERKTKG